MAPEPLDVQLDGVGADVAVRVHSRAWPGGLATFDDNWLNAELIVRGAQPWRCVAFLRARDVERFAAALLGLAAGTAAGARFEPVDPWLTVALQRDADGAVRGSLCARDIGTERVARGHLELDRDALRRLADQVAAVAAAYPPISR